MVAFTTAEADFEVCGMWRGLHDFGNLPACTHLSTLMLEALGDSLPAQGTIFGLQLANRKQRYTVFTRKNW